MKERLKALRKALGLKQREVAERLGIATGTVGQWECGDGVPGEARVYQLCKEYNVRRAWLERGEGEMFEDAPDAAKLREFKDEDVYAEAMNRLYNSLPPDAKRSFERFCDSLAKNAKESRTQTNFGSIGGDMIQN